MLLIGNLIQFSIWGVREIAGHCRHCGLDPQSPFFMVQKGIIGDCGSSPQ
jgi:hypothetical protein